MNAKASLIAWIILGLCAAQAQSPETPQRAEDISPLLIGEMAPQAELTAPDGTRHYLNQVFQSQPTVLIFYRGGWCPYCNLHLAELQSIEKDVIALGYQVVAISPDGPAALKASGQQHKLAYQLYSDADMRLAQAFGIRLPLTWRVSGALKGGIRRKNPGLLPVPSVFVLRTDGTIMFEYIRPNIKERIPARLLLAALQALKD